jgi:hypothetical protein
MHRYLLDFDKSLYKIRINGTEPIAIVLEAPEPVTPTIVATELVVRNAVAVVTAALPPSAVLGLPASGATLVLGVLFAFLRTLLLCSL